MPKKSKYFTIQELIDPALLKILTEEACWRLIPTWCTSSLDLLRQMIGVPLWINSKGLTQCGLRTTTTTTGAPYSRHKGGTEGLQAFDLHTDLPKDLKALEAIIRANHRQLRVTRIENPAHTPTWLHIEISELPVDGDLEVFNP